MSVCAWNQNQCCAEILLASLKLQHAYLPMFSDLPSITVRFIHYQTALPDIDSQLFHLICNKQAYSSQLSLDAGIHFLIR